MVYRYKSPSERYNERHDKIWAIYYRQRKEKEVIAKKVYNESYEKLSEERKRNIDHIWHNIWGDQKGVK